MYKAVKAECWVDAVIHGCSHVYGFGQRSYRAGAGLSMDEAAGCKWTSACSVCADMVSFVCLLGFQA